ncbi:MAG TPA: Ion channel protein, partial [Phytomonospora sp.]
SGADSVTTSSDASGRLLGMSTVTPAISEVIEDLLTQGRGLDLAERPVAATEIGKGPRELADVVVAVCRDGRRLHCDLTGPLREGDRLVTISAPDTVAS